MTGLSNVKSKLLDWLNSKGYKAFDDNIAEIKFSPDLTVKKANKIIVFEIRRTDSIPEVFIPLLIPKKAITNKEIEVFIVFIKKPKFETIKNCKVYGLGVLLFDGRSFKELVKSKITSKKNNEEVKKKNKKMSKTDIFISSKQEISERELTKNAILEFERSTKFPFYPRLVEEDSRYTIKNTWPCILRCLRECDLFFAILNEEHSPTVEKEIRKAFNRFKADDITIFIKYNNPTRGTWSNILSWIKKQNSVKYLPYSDISDLQSKLLKKMLQLTEKIHRRLGIKDYMKNIS